MREPFIAANKIIRIWAWVRIWGKSSRILKESYESIIQLLTLSSIILITHILLTKCKENMAMVIEYDGDNDNDNDNKDDGYWWFYDYLFYIFAVSIW